MIERQVQHMALLLDDLLDVSRITRGKLELRRERVDLRAVVDNARSRPRARCIDERRQTVMQQLPDEPIGLDADPLRLAQVLANLLTNAAKYSEPGGCIELGAARERRGRRHPREGQRHRHRGRNCCRACSRCSRR